MSASETPITDSLKADMDEGWPDRWLESHARLEQALASADTELTAAQSDPRLSRRDEWISVDERLPPNHDTYLVLIVEDAGTKYFGTSNLNPDKTGFYVRYNDEGTAPVEKVTHWQPLPPPPEGK